jgi:hypothetical protein
MLKEFGVSIDIERTELTRATTDNEFEVSTAKTMVLKKTKRKNNTFFFTIILLHLPRKNLILPRRVLSLSWLL